MHIVHVHADCQPAEAQSEIEKRLGMFRRVEISGTDAPSILAIHTDIPRAAVAGALNGTSFTVLPDMTNPEPLKPEHAASLKRHNKKISPSDTMRTAFAKIHEALPHGPLADFNPDFF